MNKDYGPNINFVKEVEKHEVLYNTIHPQYAIKKETDKAWQEVGDKFNLSAVEAREKWRNLHTVFKRRTRPPPNGSGAYTKPYYLADAMQFCLPYIKKKRTPPTRKWPPIPKEDMTEKISGRNITEENKTNIEDAVTMEYFLHPAQSLPTDNNYVQGKRSLTNTDQYLAEYFKAKKTKLDATMNEPGSNGREALKMFLISLIPELEELSDSQIKIFKRKVFTLIDEISNPISLSTTLDSMESQLDDSPNNSGTSYTPESS